MTDYLSQARSVIEIELDAIKRLSSSLDESFNGAVDALLTAVRAEKKLIVVGVGKSGNIGHKIAATFNSTGVTAVVLNSQNALHGDLGLLSEGDIVMCLSYSGETAEILDLLPFVRRMPVTVITLTGAVDSRLARYSDFVIDTAVEREACPHNLAPTSSSTAMLVAGDALAMVVLAERGFTAEDFAKYHPGGSLGRSLLTRVKEVMRAGDSFAKVGVDASVSEGLDAMRKTRCGACVVVTPDQQLAGIFTHGDFSRSFQKEPHLATKKIGELMTPHPVTVQEHSLAAEAVNILSKHRIDDLVVLNEQGHPVGLVDSQDLARFKLI